MDHEQQCILVDRLHVDLLCIPSLSDRRMKLVDSLSARITIKNKLLTVCTPFPVLLFSYIYCFMVSNSRLFVGILQSGRGRINAHDHACPKIISRIYRNLLPNYNPDDGAHPSIPARRLIITTQESASSCLTIANSLISTTDVLSTLSDLKLNIPCVCDVKFRSTLLKRCKELSLGICCQVSCKRLRTTTPPPLHRLGPRAQ